MASVVCSSRCPAAGRRHSFPTARLHASKVPTILSRSARSSLHTKAGRQPIRNALVACTASEAATETKEENTETKEEKPLPPISVLDIRVGQIKDVKLHPDADTLYVESIDVGEEEPRTIVSGLVNHVPIEEMQDRKVLVLCNLKASKMRGITSSGMVMCASEKGDGVVELLEPPETAEVGERVFFGEDSEQGPAETPNRIKKKKMWVSLQPLLKTRDDRVAAFDGTAMNTAAGPVMAKTLAASPIS
ncbi:hypothetical protein BSKO_03023 [Bryopsis sp. KO-2023]|nr:hypothetical protein BSKO_03023 [Bryopsis sp. KO-2023]